MEAAGSLTAWIRVGSVSGAWEHRLSTSAATRALSARRSGKMSSRPLQHESIVIELLDTARACKRIDQQWEISDESLRNVESIFARYLFDQDRAVWLDIRSYAFSDPVS